jgi:hypothetical protein
MKTPPSEWELTPDEIKLIQKRAQLRATTKAEFLKRYRNPFFPSVPGHFVSQFKFLFSISMSSLLLRSIHKILVSMHINKIVIVIYIHHHGYY